MMGIGSGLGPRPRIWGFRISWLRISGRGKRGSSGNDGFRESSFYAGPKAENRPMADINVTPLVDVILVLLIILW